MRREVLRVEDVYKAFDGQHALDGFRLAVYGGEVVALIGLRACGKSTLARILSGRTLADSGRFYAGGTRVQVRTPRDAFALGWHFIGATPRVVDDLTVAENVFMINAMRQKPLQYRRGPINFLTRELYESLGETVDPARRVGLLTVPEKRMVEVARAIAQDCRLLVFDDVLSSGSEQDREALCRRFAALRERGVSLLVMDSRMESAVKFADRIEVIRQGRNAGQFLRGAFDPDALRRTMVGGDSRSALRKAENGQGGVSLLHAERLWAGSLKNVGFSLRCGEILGFVNVDNSTPSDILRVLTGETHLAQGLITVDGRARRIKSRKHALQYGVAYVGGDRIEDMLCESLSALDNFIMPMLFKHTRLLLGLDRRFLRFIPREYADKIGLPVEQWGIPVRRLSPDQRIRLLLYRCLASGAKIILFDRTFPEMDDLTEQYVYDFMQQVTAMGKSIIYVSPNKYSVFRISDRVIVLQDGAVLSEEQITGRSV